MKTTRPAPANPCSAPPIVSSPGAGERRSTLRGATFAEGEAALAPAADGPARKEPKRLADWVAQGVISVRDPSKPVTGLFIDARGLMPVSQGADFGWTGIHLATLRTDPAWKRENEQRLRDLDILGALRMTPKFIVDELVEVERLCPPDRLGANPARVRAKASDGKGDAAYVYLIDDQLDAVREADRHLGSGFIDAGRVAIDWGDRD